MAAAAILNLFESKIAPLDPPSPKTLPNILDTIYLVYLIRVSVSSLYRYRATFLQIGLMAKFFTHDGQLQMTARNVTDRRQTTEHCSISATVSTVIQDVFVYSRFNFSRKDQQVHYQRTFCDV